ncbi:MAG TPA: hypothetical protein VFP34_02090 [Microlunatus sp.]|nr:hypothetical protein [Microlunatus sp.]
MHSRVSTGRSGDIVWSPSPPAHQDPRPDGLLGDGIHPQVLLGSVLSGVGAYIAVRFLERHFTEYTLRPFGYYCLAAGLFALLWINLR